MKPRFVLLGAAGLTISAALLYIVTLRDTTRGIRAIYPSAQVSIHEGHSPDMHPILDFMRLMRGRAFIPPSEWVSVSLESESGPISLATLQGYRVAILHLRRCRVTDISQLRPGMYAQFIDCDFGSLPPSQLALLWHPPDSPSGTLYYGSP